MDGFSWGTDRNNDGWWSLTQVFSGREYTNSQNTYQQVLDLAPNKPIMIGEGSSSEDGGSKAQWIASGLGVEPFVNLPQVRGLVQQLSCGSGSVRASYRAASVCHERV